VIKMKIIGCRSNLRQLEVSKETSFGLAGGSE